MDIKDLDSFTILSKSSLKTIRAGGDPPDCGNIPKPLWPLVGCDKPIQPADC